MVTWNHWERPTVSSGKVKWIMTTKQKPVTDLITELCADISKPCKGTTFTEHMFIASWQASQFQELKENLPNDWALLVMDCQKSSSPLPR